MLLVAEVPGFIKALVIIILIYFVLRFSIKLLWPYIVKYLKKKATEKMDNLFKGFQQNAPRSQTVTNDVPKKSTKIVGEYIDYEEVD